MDNNLKPAYVPLDEEKNLKQAGTVSKTTNHEETNTQLIRHIWLKEKIEFWQSLFGEKKCKHCSSKKSKCMCKRKSNKCRILSDIELKSASTQTGVQCRSTLPSGNRGCGVHLHFCIEPKVKKDTVKSNSAQQCSNFRFNINSELNSPRRRSKYISNAAGNQVIVTELLKDTTECPLNSTPKSRVSSEYLQTRGDFDSIMQEKDKSIFPKPNKENIGLHANHVIAPNEKEVGDKNEMVKEADFENTFQNQKESLRQKEPMINDHTHKTHSKILEQYPEQKFGKQPENAENIRTSILRKPTIDIKCKENLIFPLIPYTKDGFKDMGDSSLENKGMVVKGKSHEEIGLENKTKKNNIHNTVRNTFVKNSLISLRREKNNSILEKKISIILLKLSSIEDKILDLEKENVCGNNDDVTISCDGKQSTVSIEFGKKNKPNTKELSKSAAVPPIQPKERISNTIKVKSNGENIYINSNRNIFVKKQFKRKPMLSNTKQIERLNPYELDAHSLASNSYLNAKTSKSKNPQFVIQYSTNNQKLNICDKWRRISEELKISGT